MAKLCNCDIFHSCPKCREAHRDEVNGWLSDAIKAIDEAAVKEMERRAAEAPPAASETAGELRKRADYVASLGFVPVDPATRKVVDLYRRAADELERLTKTVASWQLQCRNAEKSSDEHALEIKRLQSELGEYIASDAKVSGRVDDLEVGIKAALALLDENGEHYDAGVAYDLLEAVLETRRAVLSCCGNCRHFFYEDMTGQGWCGPEDKPTRAEKTCPLWSKR